MRAASCFAGIAGLAVATPAIAQDGWPRPAAGFDVFYSADAEDTEVSRIGFNLETHHSVPGKYYGLRLERAVIKPLGLDGKAFERAYLRAGDKTGGWTWNAMVGTDGHTVLGSATIHDESKYRKEFFIEREIVETPRGIKRGIYYTFAGVSVDLPVDERNNFTAFAGAQEFTGDNVRLHLRGSYVHVVKPELGLSAQLRGRYFYSTEPREYDYYSPRWFAQVLPVLQLRRFVGGWQALAAAGYGAQRDSTQGWRSSRYLNARITSPANQRNWSINANALYSNNPTSTGFTYSYVQFSMGVTKAF